VIRDVGGSYRRAIVETVHHYSGERPAPEAIDALKAEGCWNNDWEASLELLRRIAATRPSGGGSSDGEPGRVRTGDAVDDAPGTTPRPAAALPGFDDLVAVFNGFYFGGDPDGDPSAWRGFIGDEPLLVQPSFFETLTAAGVAWGFVSGAEPPSARFVLQRRLGLADPPLIAMGDAPDKPDPTGFLRLAATLSGPTGLGPQAPPVAYLGDTVADVLTVQQARRQRPGQRFLSLAVAPPHLHSPEASERRAPYEARLREAGADAVISATSQVLEALEEAL
jgi:HAD superfamily phosphatase